MTGAEFSEVDYDLLADYVGGALEDTPDESVVAALVADDPAWRDAYQEFSVGMAAVGAQLGGLASEPMPADLAARLEALFLEPAPAGESESEPAAVPAAGDGPVAAPTPSLVLVHDADASEDGAQGVRDGKRDRHTGARPGRRLRWLTPIGIAAGLVAFVGFGLDYLAGEHATDSGDAASTSYAGNDSQAAPNSAALAGPGTAQLLSTGTDYTRATLGTAQQTEVFSAPQPASASTDRKETAERSASGGGGPLSRLHVQSALQECFDAIAAENGFGAISPESVDFARFNGSPAVIVRFSATNGDWAWASGPACGTGGGAATLDKVPVR